MSLLKFQNQVPSLFDRFLENDMFDWSDKNFSTTNTTLPAVNIKASKEGYEVEMSAPGLDKEDFKIELDNNILKISSEKKTENVTDEKEKFTRREFSYQSFSRAFTFPETVEGDKIEAKYENGILKVLIPKKEEDKTKSLKTITVK